MNGWSFVQGMCIFSAGTGSEKISATSTLAAVSTSYRLYNSYEQAHTLIGNGLPAYPSRAVSKMKEGRSKAKGI